MTDHPFIFIGQLTVYVFVACVVLLIIARAERAQPDLPLACSSLPIAGGGGTDRPGEMLSTTCHPRQFGRQMASGGGTELRGDPCRTRPLKPRAERNSARRTRSRWRSGRDLFPLDVSRHLLIPRPRIVRTKPADLCGNARIVRPIPDGQETANEDCGGEGEICLPLNVSRYLLIQ